MRNDPYSILLACQNEYINAGFFPTFVEPTEELPYHTLIVRFDGVGEHSRTIQLELAFIFPEKQSPEGVQILQTFVSFEGTYTAQIYSELALYINRLNLNLPVGAFILAQPSDVVFKANAIIDTNGSIEQIVALIDRMNGLILHIHQQFIDSIERVVNGQHSAEEAILKNSLL